VGWKVDDEKDASKIFGQEKKGDYVHDD